MGTAITTSAEEIITPHWLPGELRWIGPSDTGYDLNNIFLNDPDLEYKCKNPTGATEVVENAIDDYKLIYPNKETIGSHSKWIECLQSKLELDEAQVYNFGNDLACLAKSTYLHRVAMTIGSELNLLENISSEELRQEFEN
jgi:hypothetical protein